MVVQVVDGRVGAQRVGHSDDDGALLGDDPEPFDRQCPACVVAHLLQVAHHKDGPVRKQRQRDAQEKQIEIGKFDDECLARRRREFTEHFV